MHSVRLVGAFFCSIGITVFLFWCMDRLISGDPNIGNRGDDLGAINFGPVEIDEALQVKQRRVPKKPPPPKEPPPPPKLNVQNVDRVQSPLPNLDLPKLDIPVSGSGAFVGALAAGDPNAEGDIIPLVRIQPIYPRRAAIAKIEGYVTVEFTITETGAVTDPSVVDAKPPRVFDREAIRAIVKWKFKPRVVDGRPVSRRATQTLEFKLADV